MVKSVSEGGSGMKETRTESTSGKGADTRPHGITLENRSRAVLSGVSDVKSFHEEEVVLETAGGEMVITGKNLHIARFTLEEGSLVMDGSIDSVSYQEGVRAKRGGGTLRRIFR
jgi:sporulation protein YabP